MDLAAYLRRIGLPADPALPANLETLRRLTWHHVRHVPFENLDVQLGVAIRLDLPSVFEKLVRRRRGGYCFEQNTLFSAVLCELGYEVTPLAARVRWNATGPTPRTHMLLVVRAEDRDWIVDVGFGGHMPTAPIPFTHDVEHRERLGTFLMAREGPFHVLRTRGAEGLLDMYAFTDEPHHPIDYEAMNHFTSTHPGSRFVRNLIVSRTMEDAREAILNLEHIVRGPEGTTKRALGAHELVPLLRERFGLEVPDDSVFSALR